MKGKTKKCGIVFTSLAADDMILKIESAATGISASEKNGIFLSYASLAFSLAARFFSKRSMITVAERSPRQFMEVVPISKKR